AKHFGENYIQEAIEKIDVIGKNRICWHFIGHLQSNKAKFAVKYFEYIHTVDTLKLAKSIDKQAKKIDKIQKILVQVNIGKEETKSGTRIEETIELIKQISTFENLSLQGLMCMPPYFSDPEKARIYFKQLGLLKEKIMARKLGNVTMEHLSMGMSNDFKVAIEEGSTMVRVGTSIFGRRD
ncbi:MAG: YggS family pyridoxal phosphate-dependent enzyme, partial [Desulfobacula sp.]|nr:YggS family pyridoxal phosphate-dependent enzyme [Desulfobacula sp.]